MQLVTSLQPPSVRLARRLVPAPAAASGRRCRASRRGGCAVRATTSDFAELRSAAADAVSLAQGKLAALEQAQRTANEAREPAAEAERRWQEAHARLTSLQHDAQHSLKQLREAVTAAAGGEAVATHSLLERHVIQRLQDFRITSNLAMAYDWKEYPVQELPLHSIPGGRLLCQLAAAELDGQRYAVVSLGISNPFMFDNLRSLLLHWGCTEGAHARWEQPPAGWHTAPGVSTPAGDRAWETVLGAFAPVLQNEPVSGAAIYSVVLQVPLEGVLELRGGLKCVLKRTDGGQPEWIKGGHHNNNDFFIDFQPAINHFERKRRAAQKAAIAQARAAAIARGELLEEDEDPRAAGGSRSKAGSAAAGKGGKGGKGQAAAAVPAALSDWSSVHTADGGTMDEWEMASDDWGDVPDPVLALEPELDDESDDELPISTGPPAPEWVQRVRDFTPLSDFPPLAEQRSLSQQLKCLQRVAAAVADSYPSDRWSEGQALLQRCGDTDSLLQQLDLQELSSRAAQQEKEQLQATYKSASDEASHLMHELSHVADSARRTAVQLRGRETEVTQRDLEAVAQQAAQELMKKSSGGGIWPFKEEERQLVFVQQKVMKVSGLDAAVVVQVFVEGTKAAVQAATAPVQPAEEAAAANGNGAEAAVDASDVASTVTAPGEDTTASPAVQAAAAAAAEAAGVGSASAKKAEAAPKKPKPSFDYVVLGVALAEEFPDERLKTPLIMHLGCVAHQFAKWHTPPEKWTCTPDAVSAQGAAAQVPFQRYNIAAENGTPVFVNPTLFALALRMPLKECIRGSIRGVEFVLKTDDGQWLSWQHGHNQVSNFYAELPLPMP